MATAQDVIAQLQEAFREDTHFSTADVKTNGEGIRLTYFKSGNPFIVDINPEGDHTVVTVYDNPEVLEVPQSVTKYEANRGDIIEAVIKDITS